MKQTIYWTVKHVECSLHFSCQEVRLTVVILCMSVVILCLSVTLCMGSAFGLGKLCLFMDAEGTLEMLCEILSPLSRRQLNAEAVWLGALSPLWQGLETWVETKSKIDRVDETACNSGNNIITEILTGSVIHSDKYTWNVLGIALYQSGKQKLEWS